MSAGYAIATPSYSGDVERCRLLCASIDRFVTGHTAHYLLVNDADVALFAPLAGPRRRVLSQSALLPSWLKSWPDPLSLGRRRVWTGVRALWRGVPPLRGWHVQQLLKFAFARSCSEDVVLFVDSDVMFLRRFDLASLDTERGTRLYATPGGIDETMATHVAWSGVASQLLGLPAPAMPGPDYVNNLVSWRRDNALALLAHIEALSGRDWVSAIAARRSFSEYIIYGYFVERVLGLGAARHVADSRELCKTYWGGETTGLADLDSFEKVLDENHVAVGVQSFIGEPVARLKALFEAQSPAAGR